MTTIRALLQSISPLRLQNNDSTTQRWERRATHTIKPLIAPQQHTLREDHLTHTLPTHHNMSRPWHSSVDKRNQGCKWPTQPATARPQCRVDPPNTSAVHSYQGATTACTNSNGTHTCKQALDHFHVAFHINVCNCFEYTHNSV